MKHPFLVSFDTMNIGGQTKVFNFIVNQQLQDTIKVSEFYFQLILNYHSHVPSYTQVLVSQNALQPAWIKNLGNTSMFFDANSKKLFVITNTQFEDPNVFDIDLSGYIEPLSEIGGDLRINFLEDVITEAVYVSLTKGNKMLNLKNPILSSQSFNCKMSSAGKFTLKFKGESICNGEDLSQKGYSVCEQDLEIYVNTYVLRDVILGVLLYFLIGLIILFILYQIFFVNGGKIIDTINFQCEIWFVQMKRKLRKGQYSDARNSLELNTSKQQLGFITEPSFEPAGNTISLDTENK